MKYLVRCATLLILGVAGCLSVYEPHNPRKRPCDEACGCGTACTDTTSIGTAYVDTASMTQPLTRESYHLPRVKWSCGCEGAPVSSTTR